MNLLKPIRHLNPEYLEYLRDEPCCVCGKQSTKEKRTEPHHLIPVGAGGADETGCPLCWICHTEVGTIGLKKFEEKHNVNLWMESKRYELAHRDIQIRT